MHCEEIGTENQNKLFIQDDEMQAFLATWANCLFCNEDMAGDRKDWICRCNGANLGSFSHWYGEFLPLHYRRCIFLNDTWQIHRSQLWTWMGASLHALNVSMHCIIHNFFLETCALVAWIRLMQFLAFCACFKLYSTLKFCLEIKLRYYSNRDSGVQTSSEM